MSQAQELTAVNSDDVETVKAGKDASEYGLRKINTLLFNNILLNTY